MRSALLVLFVLAGCDAKSSATPHAPTTGPVDGSVADGTGGDAGTDAREDAGAKALAVLFIGNSYTAVNDLPHALETIANGTSTPPTIAVTAIAPGGATFEDHWRGAEARPAIASAKYSHVVLQAQSVEPLLQPAVFADYGAKLAAEAKKVDARPVLYETWARRAGDAVYAEPWSGGNPNAMQDGLLDAYRKLATQSQGTLAKAGEAWRVALTKSPAIVLHQPDGSHPTAAGTLLATYVIYRAVSGHDAPEDAPVPLGVPATEAQRLRAIAAEIAPMP